MLELQDNIIIPDDRLRHPNFINTRKEPIEMELQAVIVRSGTSLSSTHFMVYFRYEDLFYKYNDLYSDIENIGPYESLISIPEVLKNSFTFLYQFRGIQNHSIQVSRDMLRQSKVSTTAQAPQPRISRVKQQLIRQAKDLGAGQELGSLEELSPGTLHDIVYGLKSTSKKPVTKKKTS